MNIYLDSIFNIKSETQFYDLCMEAFEFQINNNPIYASYARMILKKDAPKTINEIPFLPIEFFKTDQVICRNQKIEHTFISSGTTGDQSKHLISDLSIYEKSFMTSFQEFYGDLSDYCVLALLPNYMEQEGSSLIYMTDYLIRKSNNPKSGFYLNNYEDLSETISQLEEKKQKTIILGVSYALINLAEKFPQKLKHSIVMETGGMKGKGKELIKKELHQILKSAFSIQHVHSEYGMTELLSQSYSKGENIFRSPIWKKIIIREIHDPLSIIDNNILGGINIIDLANIYSCPFIASQDLGKTYKDGTFSILGRLDNSDIRGCNLLIE